MTRLRDSDRHFLLDELGRRWLPRGMQVRKHLGAAICDETLAEFAVVNLGWIEIKHSHQRLHVRCRPAWMSGVAHGALLFYLFDCHSEKLALSVLGQRWQHYVHTRREDLLTMLDAMQLVQERTSPILLSERCTADSSPLAGRLQAVLEVCKDCSGLDQLEHRLDRIYPNRRWTISHVDVATDALMMDRKGSGFTPFNPGWASLSAAASLRDYAGSEYADWVTEARRRVLSVGEVVYDDVDATVPFPGIGFSRLTYSRVTAPISLADGRIFVLSAAETNAAVKLLKAG